MVGEGIGFYMSYGYHKGLGRFLGAFPSDTGIFTTGNGPAEFNGPFNSDIPGLKIHRFSLIPPKMLKNPKNGQNTLLNTCINWYAQELVF